MAKVAIGSNAIFTGPQKGLTTIKDRCYAYSGVVTVSGGSSADTECLNFTTGKYYILMKLNWLSDNVGNQDKFIDMTFNGISIYKGKYDDIPAKGESAQLTMIIPPLTQVIFLWGCGSGNNVTVVMAGKVYS